MRIFNINEIKNILHYDATSGLFTWKVDRNNRTRKGMASGSKNKDGYIEISTMGRVHMAHRLAWEMYHGVRPRNEIDHINGVRDDNRIINLREATRSENNRNKVVNKSSTSGIKGVTYHKQHRKWSSRIFVNGKNKNIGYFNTKEEAADAYRKEAIKLHGDFYKDSCAEDYERRIKADRQRGVA
ncbi:TPA: HNH endonuclease [Serratia marcescens]